MKRVTVFCGSSFGTDNIYQQTAYQLGQALAERGIGLVYGGASVGLMGAVANGVLNAGGEAIGVLPDFLQKKELAHNGLSKLIIVETMHERKRKMDELSDGVITLPGGFGTMEEYFEMLTWAQLGLHKKPVALLNTNEFYNELLSFFDKMVASGFLKQANRDMLISSQEIPDLITKMLEYKAPDVGKWIKKDEV